MVEAVGHKITRKGGGGGADEGELRHVWRVEIGMREKESTGSLHLSIVLYILMNKTS